MTHETPSRYFKKKLIKKLFKRYPLLYLYDFIDIGCGSGDFIEFFNELGIIGTGIDLSFTSIKQCNEKNLDTIYYDFMKYKGNADIVVMIDVLEHMFSDQLAMQKVKEICNKALIINVPANENLFSDYDEYYGHYRRYSKEWLTYILETNGFKIIEFWSYGFNFGKFFSKKLISDETIKDTKLENTLKSGHSKSSFLKKWHPFISKFYFLMNYNYLFLNKDFGTQYLVLAKKI